MRLNTSSSCITRVIVDGHEEVELAELRLIMQRIQNSLRQLVPPAQQAYVGTALLNLAICRMIRDAGTQRAATILIRLIDSVLEQESAPSQAAIDFTATHF